MKTVLVALMGLPGSGKTTLATWLANNSSFIVVSRDTIRAAMFPDCEYTKSEKVAAFRAMQEALAINLSLGKSVCTDGMTFANEEDRVAIRSIAESRGARLVEVHCDVPVAIAQDRVERDAETVFPDRNAETVIEVAGRFADVGGAALRLDMTLPTADIGERLLRAVGTAGT